MGIFDWSKTAASNTTLEGLAVTDSSSPASVDNIIRAIAAADKEHQEDTGGALTSGGSSNSYTLTTNSTLPSLADGQRLSFVASFANTGAATLNVDSLGAKSIRKFTYGGESALAAGDIKSSQHCDVEYDASAASGSGGWVLLNPTPSLDGRNVVYGTDASYASFGSAIPFDDTVPQSTEGTEVLSLSITPRLSTSRVLVEYDSMVSLADVGYVIVALFRGTTCIQARAHWLDDSDEGLRPLVMKVVDSPATTSSTTYSVRMGSFSAGGDFAYTNGTSHGAAVSGRIFGGVSKTTLYLEELPAQGS